MVSSMVAPKLAGFDLWVQPLSESDDDGDARGLPPAARPAPPGDDERRAAPERDLGLLRRLRVAGLAVHRLAHARRAPADRHGRARHHRRGRGGRHRLVGLRARRLGVQAHRGRQAAAGVVARDVALGARGRRHQPDADDQNASRRAGPGTTRPTRRRSPKTAGGGGGQSTFETRPVVAAGAVVRELEVPDGPRRRRVRRREPGLPDRLLLRRPGLPRLGRRPSRSSAAPARPRRSSPA